MNSLFSDPNPGFFGKNESYSTDGSPAVGNPPEPLEEGTVPVVADVFRYEDYRVYLKDRFAKLQSADPAFFQRGLARKAGIANPGFFNEVITGRRLLSPSAATKLANALDLTPEESDYFALIVEYAEAREPRSKLAAGKRMRGMRNRKLFRELGTIAHPLESLNDIMRELNRDWILQAAGLDLHSSPENGDAPEMRPMSESTLRSILDKLVAIREQASVPVNPPIQPSQPVVRLNLQVLPRGGLKPEGDDPA
jgi:hypothetical protein